MQPIPSATLCNLIISIMMIIIYTHVVSMLHNNALRCTMRDFLHRASQNSSADNTAVMTGL
jgi:hypothetical protein